MGEGRAIEAGPWYRQFWLRVKPHLFLKVFGTAVFTTLFFTAYINLLKNPLFPVFQMPLTVLDRMIGVFPPALLFYLSLWIYVSIPPLLFASRRHLVAYGWDIGAVCLFGLLCFLLVPTAVPPANIDWALYPGMAFLKGVDAAGNACPSLHVATAVFSAIWMHVHLRDMRWHGSLHWANWLWCIGIVYSTMATKQHVALDVLAGCLLGGLGAWFSMRRKVYQAA
ncbi:phosphatase PAP2 family protein [Uliginosibacterium gangwonense]|uniref:phosphatase PAP2 family protein n=1 Tax=Uliginosibacterium gangwonense TaxID=392736 RepID=UPI0003787EBE|nr:phosphatase PAP2 family protein [Uliginosibacterium gangwonense]